MVFTRRSTTPRGGGDAGTSWRRLQGGKRLPKAPSSPAPTQVGQDFRPNGRTPNAYLTDYTQPTRWSPDLSERAICHPTIAPQSLQCRVAAAAAPCRRRCSFVFHSTSTGAKSSVSRAAASHTWGPATPPSSRCAGGGVARAIQIGPARPRSSPHGRDRKSTRLNSSHPV